MSDLKQSTKKALIWSALDKFGQQVFLMVSGIASMRLLGASALGLVAPLALYTGLASILAEGGLAAALIRKVNATRMDYNTMFWYNVGLGVITYAALFIAAPWIARYNEMPELTLIARIQFLGIIISSLGQIHYANLIKQSGFKRLGIANVTAVMVSATAVIVLALAGFGVWALVAQTLLHALTLTAMRWGLSGFRPAWMFSGQSFREMFGFSSKIIVGSIANNISLNFYSSALGSYISTHQLGLFSQANKAKNAGVGFMVHIFGNSLFLMLAQLQEDTARFRQALRKSVRTVSFVLFPAMLGLSAVCPALLYVAVGEDWMPAVPYLRILCFSGVFYTLSYIYGNAFKARGRSDITLTFEILNAVLLISFLFLTIRHGLGMALWADVACRFMIWIGYSVAAARVFGYRLIDQWRDMLPYAALAAVMAGIVIGLQYLIPYRVVLLTAQLITGAVFYLGINKLLGSTVLNEVLDTWKKKKV